MSNSENISVATFSLTEGDNGSQVSIIFSDGSAETITDKHANFDAIKVALVTKPEGYGAAVYDLANITKTVGRKFKDLSPRVSTDGTNVYFDGDEIDGAICKMILKLLREDAQKAAAFFDGESDSDDKSEDAVTWEALVKFLELLYANPNPQSRESLYEFINLYGLTIRRDGHFIAYKGLEADFGSVNKGYGIVDGVEVNGTLYNKPGSILRFPRKDVDSNTSVGCSQGLHAGTHAYASGWNRGKLVAVAINPMNVVSVPDDCTHQKLRVCEYEVLNEVDPLESAAATRGWDDSDSYWPGDWDDDYSGEITDYDEAIDDLGVTDIVSFDYVSLSGESKRVENAAIEEFGDDYFKAYLTDRDVYRTYKFSGISNLVVEGDESEEDSEEETHGETSNDASGGDFFDSIKDKIFPIGDFPESLRNISDGIGEDLKNKAKQILKDSGLDEVLNAASDLFGGTSDRASLNDVEDGDVVSFDYVSASGESQHVARAEVQEVSAEYFKAYVPAKDGYRTYKFDSVSNFVTHTENEAPAENDVASEPQIRPTSFNIGDKVDVLLADGRSVSGATVLLSNSNSLTVKLQSGGYDSFTLDSIVAAEVRKS